MRPLINARARAAMAAGGALGFAVMLVAGASAAAQQSPGGAAVTASIRDRHLRYGQSLVVRGRLGGGEAGRPVALEFHPRGGDWRTLRKATTAPGGVYSFAVRLASSGAVRVTLAPPATVQPRAVAARQALASPERPVVVTARISTRTRRVDVLAGRAAAVTGVLRPRRAGRLVLLQMRGRRGWRTVARDRTTGSGRYRLRFTPRRTGSAAVRVAFPGDRLNDAAARRVGRLNAYRTSLASWYGPGFYGNRTGCGQRLTPGMLGVANKSLPCGTMVTFRYRGRSVRVPVIDRGPYSGAREWDLTGATARALGFGGAGVVWVTR